MKNFHELHPHFSRSHSGRISSSLTTMRFCSARGGRENIILDRLFTVNDFSCTNPCRVPLVYHIAGIQILRHRLPAWRRLQVSAIRRAPMSPHRCARERSNCAPAVVLFPIFWQFRLSSSSSSFLLGGNFCSPKRKFIPRKLTRVFTGYASFQLLHYFA